MSLSSVDDLLATLRQLQLLSPVRLDELARTGSSAGDPRALVKELVQRGWLTPYQVNHLLKDRAADLVLGPYLLLDRLGEGSRGQIFKARHQKMHRIVALKVIRKELLADGAAVQRFYEEVERASQLAHVNILHAYDAGPIGPTHFLAMEYVEGTDLARKVEQEGPLPWRQACAYVAQAALGLQHAHERGLVHRDITPDHLFITTSREESGSKKRSTRLPDAGTWGMVKVMNFGQGALRLGADGDQAMTPQDLGRQVLDYVAPELALGRAVDVRADIYGLGCTFYFLLTGRPPYPGGRFHAPAEGSEFEELVPDTDLPSDVPLAVADVMRRMMMPAPADRFQTPAEVLAALADAAGGDLNWALHPGDGKGPAVPLSAGEKRRLEQKRRQSRLIWASGLVLLVGLGVMAFLLRTPAKPTTRDEIPDTDDTAAHYLKRLEKQARARPEDAELWAGFVDLRRRFPETPEAQAAASWLRRVPSPLDRLVADRIRTEERYPAWQPSELVGICGEQRWRQWTPEGRCLAFSPKGQVVASAGNGDLIHLWDVNTGRLLHLIHSEQGLVRTLAFTPDGSLLASGGEDKNIRLWNPATGIGVGLFPTKHAAGVLAIAFSRDGKQLASGSADKTVCLWDVPQRKHLVALNEHKHPVQAVAFAPDGQTVASGGADGTLYLWDVKAKKARANVQAHAGMLYALAFAPEGWHLASAGHDKKVKLWDAEGKQTRGIEKHAAPVTTLAFTPDGRTLATGSHDAFIKLWDLESGKERTPALPKQEVPVQALAFSPDGKLLVVGATWEQNALRLWDMTTLKPAVVLTGHKRWVRALAFTPDCRTLVTTSGEPGLRWWDTVSSQEKTPALTGLHGALTLAVSPDGQTVAAVSKDHRLLTLWDLGTGAVKTTFPKGHGDAIESLAFAPDGKTLASGGRDKLVRLWDVPSGKEKANIATENVPTLLAFVPDSHTLVIAGYDIKSVRLWDIEPAAEKLVLKNVDQGTIALAVSADGRLLAASGRDRLVRLWDLPSGRERREPVIRPAQPHRALQFTPDGQTVFGAGGDGVISFWRLFGKAPPRTIAMPGPVYSMALAADGRHLATGNGNGSVYLLRLGPVSAGGD